MIKFSLNVGRTINAAFFRCWLLIALALIGYTSLSMRGNVIASYVWANANALDVGGMQAFLAFLAFYAGRESRSKALTYWGKESNKWHGQYRAMFDMNKTMIDDVIAAQAAGVKVKTFLYGCGMGEKPPVRDPADAPGVAL